MPVKRGTAGNRGVPSRKPPVHEPDRDDMQRFVNAEAKRRFGLYFRNRKFLHEKGFIFMNDANFGLPDEVAEIIKLHGWRNFAMHPINPIAPLVCEFYANIITGSQTFSMVRGVKVSFSASSINMHFGLLDCEDTLRDSLDMIGTAELNRLLGELAVKGTYWLPDRGKGVYLCSRPLLKPFAKIWYHFIRTRLLPTSHIETVNKERLVLLSFILEGKEINVGKLIQKEISACAFKNKGYLFFPSLVTHLCLRSGVDVKATDEVLNNTAAISTVAIKRFTSDSTKAAHNSAAEPSSPIQAQFIQQLNFLIKNQQKVWKFIKEAHQWEKKMFQLNFSRKLLPSPIFPDEVFQPYGPEVGNETADDEDDPVEPDESAPEETEPSSSEESQEIQSDEQTLRDIISPKKKTKASCGLKKRQLLLSDSEDEVTPSPGKDSKRKAKMPVHQEPAQAAKFSPFAPLAKKRKTWSTKKGLKVKMTAAEIRHFYSSSEEEERLSKPVAARKREPQVKEAMKPLFDAMEAQEGSDGSDVALTREVDEGSTHTMQKMAQADKRRQGLHKNT